MQKYRDRRRVKEGDLRADERARIQLEIKMLMLIAESPKTNRQIADAVGCCKETVKLYLKPYRDDGVLTFEQKGYHSPGYYRLGDI